MMHKLYRGISTCFYYDSTCPGILAVNKLTLRAEPKMEVWFTHTAVKAAADPNSVITDESNDNLQETQEPSMKQAWDQIKIEHRVVMICIVFS